MQYYVNPDLVTYTPIYGGAGDVQAGTTAERREITSGNLNVFGSLYYTKIDANAAVNVGSGGEADFGVVEAGATLDVQAGGSASYWDVYGNEIVEAGATANYSTIELGVTSVLGVGGASSYFDVYGRQIIDAGATAYYTTVEQGATAEALAGGTLVYGEVYGALTVDAGATANYVAVATGGVVTLNAGAKAFDVGFDAAQPGGRLVVKSNATKLGDVLGLNFGDMIDFAGLSYSANGSLSVSSLNQASGLAVTLTEGGVVESFNLLNAVANPVFTVRSDGAGGTLLAVETDYVAPTPTHANDIARSGDVTGPYNFIDALNLEASYGDLIHAFGNNASNMQNWLANNQAGEKRQDSFDGLDYVASYGDLIQAFKHAGSKAAILDAGASHFIQNGLSEGRSTSFNSLDYIASYGDLIQAFGVNGDAGAYHYIENGMDEGRSVHFDGLAYIASYGDLMQAFGANEQAGAAHYIQNGFAEGRTTSFDGLDYIAGYSDLMSAFGANSDAGASHYIKNGRGEGRSAHSFNVAAYESAHPDLIGRYGSDDAFLTAYINYYAANKTLLT